MRTVIVTVLVLLGSLPASGQAPAQPKPTEGDPPAVTVGKGVIKVRSQARTVSALAIAPDAAAYTEAISSWTANRRFPVLIDDGTPGARHDIARFIHSFQPRQVLYLQPGDEQPSRQEIDQTVADAWDAAPNQSAQERWTELDFIPPGVIVTSESDPAWTAALALAADRGQPIIWVEPQARSVDQVEPEASAREWRQNIRNRIDELGFRWASQGDDIEALTICMTMSSKLRIGESIMAMTDFVTRNDDESMWGACGMIFGSEAKAAYTAMSALFLQPRSVWMFDGYTGNTGFQYAVDRAAAFFREVEFDRVMVDPRPNGGRRTWRARLRGGVDAGLIFVNSSGHSRWFTLGDDRAYGSDVPFLRQPAVVHFIHSFSSQIPAIPESIAARWIDQGAFIYYGSADEPNLAAFLTPEQVTARMLRGMPTGFAFRYDELNKVWKLNYFGDPLFTLGKLAPPLDEAIDLEGAVPLEQRLRTTLREQNFDDGIAALVMLGRHADVVRLCRSLVSTRAEDLTPNIIEAALPSHLFEREPEALAAIYARLPADRAKDARNTTILWHALRPELDRINEQQAGLLRLSIRTESADDDAASLAPALRRLFGENAVRAMYAQLLTEADNDQMRVKLRNAYP